MKSPLSGRVNLTKNRNDCRLAARDSLLSVDRFALKRGRMFAGIPVIRIEKLGAMANP
jgi:hypothetical protein